jgi:hypothetical protein
MVVRARLLFGGVLLATWVVNASCGGREIASPVAPTVIPTVALTTPASGPGSGSDTAPAQPDAPLPAGVGEAVLIGAGDIAVCDSIHRADATARLMESLMQHPGAIAITLGDNSNNEGRPDEYGNCFRSTWGRLNLRPSPGNHDDYDERLGNGGTAYFQYFGAQAGPASLGYYSFDAGSWHVVSLNSEIMNRGSHEQAQLAWLRSDLAATAEAACTVAYFHRPVVSSGEFAAQRMSRLWDVLYAAGADLVINGHEHFYERFAPQTPTGGADPAFGIRQFIVGTGGAHFHRAGARAPNSELVIQDALGVIKLTLRPSVYDWEFVDVSGAVRDSGNGRCHGQPPPR